MKKSTLVDLKVNPQNYVVIWGWVFKKAVPGDIWHEFKVEDLIKDFETARVFCSYKDIQTSKITHRAILLACGRVDRSEYVDTAMFLDTQGNEISPKHGEKVPPYLKAYVAKYRCRLNHITDMNKFCIAWSDRVRAGIKKFGIRESNVIDDLEQTVYLRMITFRILEDCICALEDSSAFSTHSFGVIRAVCLNYLRDNGKSANCSKCEKHEDCVNGYCLHCKYCRTYNTNPDCKVCKSCNSDSYRLCPSCGVKKVCKLCKLCYSCRNEREKSVRNVLSQAEPLLMGGEDGEEYLHPEVVKLCDDDGIENGTFKQFEDMLYLEMEEIDSKSPKTPNGWTLTTPDGEQHRMKSLTMIYNMDKAGLSPSEIGRQLRLSAATISLKRKLIGQLAQKVFDRMNVPMHILMESAHRGIKEYHPTFKSILALIEIDNAENIICSHLTFSYEKETKMGTITVKKPLNRKKANELLEMLDARLKRQYNGKHPDFNAENPAITAFRWYIWAHGCKVMLELFLGKRDRLTFKDIPDEYLQVFNEMLEESK
jgi:hypothetical protein